MELEDDAYTVTSYSKYTQGCRLMNLWNWTRHDSMEEPQHARIDLWIYESNPVGKLVNKEGIKKVKKKGLNKKSSTSK